MTSVEELTADLDELKSFRESAKRDNTKRILDREIK